MASAKIIMHKLTDSLREKTRNSLLWGIGNQFSKQFFSFATTLLLVRLLMPVDFGLISMVLVFSSFSTILINLGFSTAIIQRPNITDKELSSIFWLNMGLGVFLTSTLYFGAPLIAIIYKEPKIAPIARMFAYLYLILGFYMVPRALLEKRLNFKSIAIAETSALIISSIVAIILAFDGYGVWALVAQQLIKHLWTSAVIWHKAKWRPHLIFDVSSLLTVGHFSFSVLYSSILHYLSVNVDRFLIGKYVGKAPLGLYDKSFILASMPRRNISQIILTILFSSFSHIQADNEKTRKVYIKAMRFIAFINFPIMIGIFSSTRSFVLTLFGSNWGSMIPFLRIFTIALIFNSFGTLLGSIMLAKGMSSLVKKDATIRQGATILGAIIGITGGNMGVAYGILIASIFNFFLTLHHVRLAIFLPPLKQLKNIQSIFFAAITMGLGIYAFQQVSNHLFSSFWTLCLNTILGILIYLTYLRWKDDTTMNELIQTLTKK